MTNLTYLDLSNNQLTSLSFLQHLQTIQTLLLNSNQISIIPKPVSHLLSQPSIKMIDLRENPYECDCELDEFQAWITTDLVVNIAHLELVRSEIEYKCFSPSSFKGLSITQVDMNCESHLLFYIAIGIPSAIFFIAITVLAVRYRWHIRYRMFLLLHRRRNYQNYIVNDDANRDDDDDDENGPPLYDAYVTYHRADEDWVDEELLPNIEEGEEPFRLCLRTRNICAGRLVFNELSLRIQRSRKVLVILSPKFLGGQLVLL